MDSIFIEGLVYTGTHGCNPNEKRVRQRFAVDVRVDIDTAVAQSSDKLPDTYNYARARDIVRAVIEGEHNYLIERLARRMADVILEDRRLLACEISIRKLDIWGNGVPGVRIARTRVQG